MSEESYIADYMPDDGYTGSITSLPGLKMFLGEADPFYDYIKAIKIDMPPGANIIGILQTRWRLLWEEAGVGEMADLLLMNIEQRRINLGDKNTERKIHFSNPIAYDVYYLYYAGNVLLNSRHPEYTEHEWIVKQIGAEPHSITDDNYMYDYFHTINPSDALRPLRQPLPDENMDVHQAWGTARGFSSVWGMNTNIVANSSIVDTWRYVIKEARFEIVYWKLDSPYWPMKTGPYDSKSDPPDPPYGPKEKDSHEPYAGYIAFPVGQLGVMWKMGLAALSPLIGAGSSVTPYSSMAGTFTLRPSGSTVHPVDYSTTVEEGGKLLPPFTMATSEVPGELLMDKGYLIADKTCVEFPAEPFEGVDNWKLHYWLRYWIKKDNTEIIPGEFVGLICKPWPVHCWFYQESSPFLYAGNWIETEFYTSGIVKEVIEPWTSEDPMPSEGYYDPEDQVSTALSNHYRVWVKGEEMIVESSDWKVYEEGERVGLLKRTRDGEGRNNYVSAAGLVDADPGPGTNFDWQGLKYMKLKGKNTSDDDIYTREWVIVPVHFFPDVNLYPSS